MTEVLLMLSGAVSVGVAAIVAKIIHRKRLQSYTKKTADMLSGLGLYGTLIVENRRTGMKERVEVEPDVTVLVDEVEQFLKGQEDA